MSSQAKVGSWLAKTDADDDDDAPSESGSSASSAEVNGAATMSGSAAIKPFEDASDEEEEGDPEATVEEEINWEVVLPKVRLAVMDPSANRRRAFVTRYLTVSAEAPPADKVPALTSILLSCLPLLQLPQHVDDLVDLLIALVNRDEQYLEKAGDKLKLGVKLVKWVTAEIEKTASSGRTITSSSFIPYLFLVLALLSSLKDSRDQLFASSAVFSDLISGLAIVVDAIETRQAKGKENAKAGRFTRRVGIRVWRALRQLRDDLPEALEILLDKPSSIPYRNACLIGHIVGVSLRLRPAGKRKSEDNCVDARFRIIETKADAINDFYASNILSAKTAVPLHAARALAEFHKHFLSYKVLTDKLVPLAERMLLRSPDSALDLTTELIQDQPHDVSPLLPARMIPSILSAAKSSNVGTRSKACDLLRAVFARCSDTTAQAKVATQILALPKTGKTSSAEHRSCLFSMAALVPTSTSVSLMVVETLVLLIGKEPSEPALSTLCSALALHLTFVLSSTTGLSSDAITTIANELNSAKLSTRRLVSAAVGEAIWTAFPLNTDSSSAADKLITAVAAAFESNLHTALNNLPANPAGFLEGYVAAALAFGPLADSASATKLVNSSALQSLLAVTPKPSFVVNAKIWQKLPSSLDEQWLLRCLQVAVSSQAPGIDRASARTTVGLALIYLAFDGKDSAVRREALAAIARLMRTSPSSIARILRDGLRLWLKENAIRQEAKKGKATAVDEDVVASKSYNIGRLLAAIFSVPPSTDKAVLEDVCVDFLILSHHPEITENAQTSWIGLVQSIRLDPATLVADKKDKIIKLLFTAAGAPPEDVLFAEAAYRAATTLCFLCPTLFTEIVLEQIRSDLDPSQLTALGEEEKGIWQSPPNQPFVDVLTTKKDATEVKNRKGYADDKWDQEVRESIAKKKAASGAGLSKQDKALIDAQLAKEEEIRMNIAIIQARLQRGIALVSSLLASSAEAVGPFIRELAEIMMSSVFANGSFLVTGRAFEVFLQIGALANERLGEYRRLLAAAILRTVRAPLVPSDYLEEPVGELVTRILHQLFFLAETTALDSVSYALASILMNRVIVQGGVGTTSPQSEEAQEQITLVVNIVAACCGEFTNTAYPRHQTIKDLLKIIATYSKLSKDATSALVDIGAALGDAAEPAEIKEMIAGTLSKDSNVRNAALQALQPIDLTDLDYCEELWLAAHDADEQNASLALHLWEDNGLDVPATYLKSLLAYLAHDSAAVRLSCAAALADAAQQHPSQMTPTIEGLQYLYTEKAKILQPEYDRFGMVIRETVNREDPYEARTATATALAKLAFLIPIDLISMVFDFLISAGPLGDRHPEVRTTMLNAAITMIDIHGKQVLVETMKRFEDYLARPGSSTEPDDYVKEAVVVLFGRLAGHLDPTDERIPHVVERLVGALDTPSESVQVAVADCLPQLVHGMGNEAEYLVDQLFSSLTTGAKYAGRRGAAYGLAGVIKGRGLQALREYDLMDKLRDAAEDKSAYQSRQGALFAFETLSTTMGKAFEPYIISIIPLLLTLFGDGNSDVREATQDASKVIMSRISGHCVKLILPTLLGGLDEKQWRTKKGSIELLGAMAFCAPRQLSLSLPTIIPQLTGVINDTHAQVKSAANTSLKRFGEVLNNPEIKAIQSTLMKALADPSAKTNSALTALLKTNFEHYLDAPSLALVMPIIDRGLRNRSSDTKRRAVQIVGNMASLTESRDLTPYLDELMPLVHEVLVDPVPEARATAAKSLGTLVERLGETHFPSLVKQLLQTLRSDTSGVDRQGAAQGLSEVLSGLGMERMEGLLPEIINNTASPRPYVREGFISLLVYLPTTFGHRFAPHLGRVVPPIVTGLADDSEFVREASMRAGKMIIANYSAKAIDLLLPELEKGMLDGTWRIRQSSISLTGELLYKVTGISGKVELEEEDAPAQAADATQKALLEALGQERRDRILATLYIVRQDPVGIVRQASVHIWKALVQHTPRTTLEILPVLMQLLTELLGCTQGEQQETASRTLGELCRKSGDRIVGEIITILKKAIGSSDERTKEGACLAFADVMAATSKDVISDHEDTIISAVRTALVDTSADVRAAAARTFDTMQHYMGAKAIDQTIPTLLEAMRDPGETSETALQALKEVMSVRANSVFPVLIPTLIAQPISAFNARALGALVKVAGSALNRRLDTVLGALVTSIEKEKSAEVREDLDFAIEALLSSVVDSDGVHLLEMLLIGWAKDKSPRRRVTACNTFATMCQVSSADASDYRTDWIRILISLFDDSNEDVVTAAWEALEHFVKTVGKDELEDLVVPLRRSIDSCPKRHVAGFCRPKGPQSIVPILLAGLLSGTQEQREQAALGIGELAQRTTEEAIKPYMISLTGPLIRVISGQAIAPQIKAAILLTLTILLEEIPVQVRAFHPQLTRTFVKSASDPTAISVRSRAATGLAELMKHQARVDPLVTELIGVIRSSEKDIASSVAQALAAVCSSAAKDMGPKAKSSIIDLCEDAFTEGRGETYNTAIGRVVAGIAKHDSASIRPIVDTFLAAPTPPTTMVNIVILAIMEEAPNAFHELDVVEEIIEKVNASVSSDVSITARPAREARELMRSNTRWKEDAAAQAMLR